MSSEKYKSLIPANHQIDDLEHNKFHIQFLLNEYPDLQIIRERDNIGFFSSKINSAADECCFMSNTQSGYNDMHFVSPYKNIKINCNNCEGSVKVFTIPFNVPLFLFWCKSSEEYIYNMSYEDFLISNTISQNIVGKCHLYILAFLESKIKNGLTLKGSFLNQSIKKLLPFT